MIRLLPVFALLAASPVAAKGLTVRTGETWIFSVEHGQPVHARKTSPATAPARGQIKVALQPLMGTTLSMTNNSKFDYAYRAILVLPGGKAGPAKSCAVPANGKIAIENWPLRAAAVRLSDFKPAPAGSLCP